VHDPVTRSEINLHVAEIVDNDIKRPVIILLVGLRPVLLINRGNINLHAACGGTVHDATPSNKNGSAIVYRASVGGKLYKKLAS
jgi:hypothetical protein